MTCFPPLQHREWCEASQISRHISADLSDQNPWKAHKIEWWQNTILPVLHDPLN